MVMVAVVVVTLCWSTAHLGQDMTTPIPKYDGASSLACLRCTCSVNTPPPSRLHGTPCLIAHMRCSARVVHACVRVCVRVRACARAT